MNADGRTRAELRAMRERRLVEAQRLHSRAEADGKWSSGNRSKFDQLLLETRTIRERIETMEYDGDVASRRIVGPNAGIEQPTDSRRAHSGGETPTSDLRSFGHGESIYDAHAEERDYGDHWREVSVGGYLRAALTGEPRTDAEERALSEGVNAGGGFTVPSPLNDRIIDKMRERSILSRLGVRFVPMDSKTFDFARVAGDVSGAWTPEGSTTSSTDMSFERVTLTSRKFMALMKASRELVDDAVGLDVAIERSFFGTMTSALQDAVFVGSTAASQPLGIQKSTEISFLSFGGSTNGATVSSSGSAWNQIILARQNLLDANVEPSRLSAVWSPRVERQFWSLKATDNQPLLRPAILNDIRFHATPDMPTNIAPSTSLTNTAQIHLGDYSKVMVGVRLDPQLEILREKYANSYQLGFVGAARWDVQFEQPNALIRLERITT